MSDATLARMEHGKYVGVRGEPRRDGVYVLRKPTLYVVYVRYPRYALRAAGPCGPDPLTTPLLTAHSGLSLRATGAWVRCRLGVGRRNAFCVFFFLSTRGTGMSHLHLSRRACRPRCQPDRTPRSPCRMRICSACAHTPHVSTRGASGETKAPK